jgi:hypothetical protein
MDSLAAVNEISPATFTTMNPPGISAVFVLGLLVKLVILLPIEAEINYFQNC